MYPLRWLPISPAKRQAAKVGDNAGGVPCSRLYCDAFPSLPGNNTLQKLRWWWIAPTDIGYGWVYWQIGSMGFETAGIWDLYRPLHRKILKAADWLFSFKTKGKHEILLANEVPSRPIS